MIPTPFAAAQARKHRERLIDEALAESFPASDPPAWTLGPDLEGEAEAEPPKTSTTEAPVTSSADPSRTTPRRRRRRSRRG
jgi:hypothetical protein